MKKRIYFLALLFPLLTGCDDFFTPNTDDALLEKDYIGTSYELYTGYMGLAACVQDVVDQAMFLEGLRGDLLEPTTNASIDMWDVYNYKDLQTPFTDNELADPKGFYALIMNSNDYLKHVFEYREQYPTVLSDSDYKGIIGGALRYKAWAYLMLAKIYGEAVYLDDPLATYQDLSQYPVLKFDQLIDKCISLVENGMNGINGKGDIRWSTVLYPGQSDSPESLEWNRICPTPECLLAELYLYKTKKENSADENAVYYQKVWDNCVSIIRTGGEQEASFTLNKSKYEGSWSQLFSTTTYNRQDHISVAFYDYSKKQTNRVIEYFSNTYPNKYYLRPAVTAVTRWEISGANDQKNRGINKSYKESTEGLIFYKFLGAHTTSDYIYRNDVPLCYYKAADIHLWLAEACAGLGRYREALQFLNGQSSARQNFGSLYNKATNTFSPPFSDYPVCLYQCVGKESQLNCQGVRGRIAAPALGEWILGEDEETNEVIVEPEYAHWMVDSLLVEESRLESAGEARTYYTMLRSVRRWGDKARKIWADKVAEKYVTATSVGSNLETSDENWFIRYDLKLNK